MEETFQQGIALHREGRLEEAEAIYRQLVDWRPAVLHNLGVILRITGRLDEAETVLRRAIAANPTGLQSRYTLGMTLLQAGKYAEGWVHYETRFQLLPKPPSPPLPDWRGESLAGKRLVVVGEQGLGDQILLSRFVGMTGADEVAFACARPLVRLLSALPVEAFNPRQSWDEGGGGDCWTYLGQIPRWLELGPRDAPAPYLPCPQRPVSGAGLMLEGAPGNGNNARRLPSLAVAAAIRDLAPFVDLNPEASGARDFADTAETVAGLERVVSVDTSVAHLAGAMGKPCWVMAPAVAIDWWTSWKDDRSAWYPSVRVVRQRQPGDWAGVVADLTGVLAQPAAQAAG
ncbi:tetratricopeptide repeat-containing glycosyltransferase family protein [Phenylobacterium sp.]|uniref:tetratricopeptide repeat-containing glycosyltransferase family protein n=1 Tax=Phenylobacterium sp. TaxID=1871053 RepID=UPI00121821AE|nr:tetratricopeptide repeat-containing glycosyltransferase family protein [Phenylobacterium sp.]THD61000.1 MAG: glycosyltransferase family 41 protein [Phenylobacterium sp.]